MSFADRGKIMVEQVELMRQLWTEEVVDYSGRFHTVTAAGINPLPVQRPIPLWFGGQSPVVLKRVGRLADGWFPYYPSFDPVKLTADLEVIHESAREAGRDPGEIEIEGAVYFYDERFEMSPTARMPPTTLDECAEYAHWWKDFGANRYWVTAPWATPFLVMTLNQSLPSFPPLIHFPPSEIGSSSSRKRVLYDLVGFRASD